ncbi:hypothetical protein FO519_008750 [Halicephalobus sp. NKZ332]|nr:hypothetical protein FO519_008750 [Halicephalobus sp. NKZ332]
MSESSGGQELSSEQEDEWLQKAVEQLENGMNITVEYLGKMELQMSISKEPDPERRIDVIVGCLRTIAKESGILENPKIPEATFAFLEGARVRAKAPRLAALNISVKGFGLALVDFTVANPVMSWHPVREVAFAHIDPEHENIVGYYATKKSTGQRFCYAIRTSCGSHVLACMKLAFTVFEQQNIDGNIDLRTVADAMTPSPTTPSKGGAYSLLRISSPSEDSKELVHREIPIPIESIQRQVIQFPKAVKKDEKNNSGNPSVTNIYLNVVMPPPSNPYHVQKIYRGLGSFFGGGGEQGNQKSPILEKIVEQSFNDSEEEIQNVPPLTKKPEKFTIRPRDNLNLLELEDRIHPGHENLLYPEVRLRKEAPEDPGERLRRERRLMKERLRIKSFRLESSPEVLEEKPKKKITFRKLRNSLKRKTERITVPLKKKLGSLRIQEKNDEKSLKSEYSSLNSKSFDGSISSESSSSPSSTDSGVIDEDELFVFPENPADAPSWRNRIFRSQQSLPISASRFAQISEYLDEEPWFHGTIRRDLSEARLVKDGEFLVRQSAFQPGQFILSVLRRKTVHHICLVNQQGQIRSYGNEFGSIVQLIQYHFATRVPMCTKTTAVILDRPVARP